MDSSKNGKWIIPLKKFSRLRVNTNLNEQVPIHLAESGDLITHKYSTRLRYLSVMLLVIVISMLEFNSLNLLDFLKWNKPPCIFGTLNYYVRVIKMRT